MKTLKQIKEEYANQNGYRTWNKLLITLEYYLNEIEIHMDEVSKRYAEEYAKEALRLASENVKMKLREDYIDLHMNDEWREVDKQSILSEENLPKHR